MKTLSQEISDIRGLIHIALRLPFEQRATRLQEASDKMLQVAHRYETRRRKDLEPVFLVLDLLLKNFVDLDTDILYIKDYPLYKWTIDQLRIFRDKLQESGHGGPGETK